MTSSLSNSSKHKIAICQLTCTADKQENFDACKKLIMSAKDQGAEVKMLFILWIILEKTKSLTF